MEGEKPLELCGDGVFRGALFIYPAGMSFIERWCCQICAAFRLSNKVLYLEIGRKELLGVQKMKACFLRGSSTCDFGKKII